jgi:metal-dependent hydrolase (beta-lactamase superfamily II)
LKEKLNLTPDDIDIILYTHLHLDHCSSSSLFKNARHIVQEDELKAAFNKHPMFKRFFYRPELIKDVKFETVRGDKKIVEGVSVMLTPGHTPGSQSVVLETAKGKAGITSMCARAENFEPIELKSQVGAKEVLVVDGGGIEKNIDPMLCRWFKGRVISWSRAGTQNVLKLRLLRYDRKDWNNYWWRRVN